jgi:hypothetical protein
MRAARSSSSSEFLRNWGRSALRVIRRLRIEDPNADLPVGRFQDFRRAYRSPVAIYSCCRCRTGEAKAVEQMSVEAFQARGGKLTLLGALAIQKESPRWSPP